MFQKEIVIDGKGHLVGRLASTVAKELLLGQHIVVVRCEGINISGSLFRNKLKFMDFLSKRMNTNPRRGPFHYRAPSRMFWRSVRGMLSHKTPKGEAALARLKVFDGCPFPYDHKKRLVVPDALRVIRLQPHRKYAALGDLAKHVGWTHADAVEKLEGKRTEKAKKYYERKRGRQALLKKAHNAEQVKSIREQLNKIGSH